MTRDIGRVPDGTGLSQAEPASRLGPTGFDPSRGDLFGQAEPEIRIEVEFNATGEARLILKYTWDDSLPVAAFLMNNPSRAGGEADFDPTARRTIHFAKLLGAGGSWLVNWCPLVATDPADLWRLLRGGAYTDLLRRANARACETAGRQAKFRIIACGPTAFRQHYALLAQAMKAFLWHYPPIEQKHPALCLGVTDDGAPLHPLARGKFAVPNGTMPRPWRPTWNGARPFGHRDSDGSPKGRDRGTGLDGEAATARAEGIAQGQSS